MTRIGRLPNPALDAQLAATGRSRAQALDELAAAERQAGRACGGCTVCCTVVGVPELDKAAGAVCAHCTGDGCAVHAGRPDGCRVYACAWKLGLGEPCHRPDRIGGLLEWHQIDEGLHPYGGHWVFRPADAGDLEPARELLERLLGLGCLVLVVPGSGAAMTMLYPDPTVDDAAGTAPAWDAEQAGEPTDYRIATYASYAGSLPPAMRRTIESGALPFVE